MSAPLSEQQPGRMTPEFEVALRALVGIHAEGEVALYRNYLKATLDEMGRLTSELAGVRADATAKIRQAAEIAHEARAEVERLRSKYGEAVATVARLEQKRVELERIANAERERVAQFEPLRLGDPTALVSHRCGNPTHPTWLTAGRADRRGCPWCRLAEVERIQQPVGQTVFLADYDGAEDGPKLFATLDAAQAWVADWSSGDGPWDWFERDGIWEQWGTDPDSDRPAARGAGTVSPLTLAGGAS